MSVVFPAPEPPQIPHVLVTEGQGTNVAACLHRGRPIRYQNVQAPVMESQRTPSSRGEIAPFFVMEVMRAAEERELGWRSGVASRGRSAVHTGSGRGHRGRSPCTRRGRSRVYDRCGHAGAPCPCCSPLRRVVRRRGGSRSVDVHRRHVGCVRCCVPRRVRCR